MAIEFVGARSAGKAGASSGNTTLVLSSGLTGGTRDHVEEGDLVIGVYVSHDTAAKLISDGTTAYTAIGSQVQADDTFNANLDVAYKFMGASPDASTTFGPSGGAASAAANAVLVFSGVDQSTPLDVASTSALDVNNGQPNPPSITPSTAGAVVVGVGGAGFSSALTFTSSDLSGFTTAGGTDNNSCGVGGGYSTWTSGAFNPAQWGGGTTNSQAAWAARTIALRPASGSVTLAADSGSFALTGTAMTPKAARLLIADGADLALTGGDLTFAYARAVVAESSSYGLTGGATDLDLTRRLVGESGALALTGQDVALTFGRTLVTAGSSFALVGDDVLLDLTRVLAGGSGSFTLTGSDVTLLHGRVVTMAETSFTLTGIDAALKRGLRVDAAGSTFMLVGTDVVLRVPRIELDTVSFALSGGATGLSVTRRLSVENGSFVLVGTVMSARATRMVSLASGNFSLVGAAAALQQNRVLAGGSVNFTLTGDSVVVLRGLRLPMDGTSFALTGGAVTPRAARYFSLDKGEFFVNMTGVTITYSPLSDTEGDETGRIIVLGAEERIVALGADDTRIIVIAAEDRVITLGEEGRIAA